MKKPKQSLPRIAKERDSLCHRPGPIDRGMGGSVKTCESHCPPARDIARAGLRKVVDYQDIAYGAEYLDHLFAAGQG